MDAASEDDDEVETLERALGAVSLKRSNVDVRVRIEGRELKSSKALLEKHCKYFQALFSFTAIDDDAAVEIKGGIDYETLKTIIFSVDTGRNCVEETNAENILLGSAFLQCHFTERQAADLLTSKLDISNCFRVLILARDCGSKSLFDASDAFIVGLLETFVFRPKSTTDILELSPVDFAGFLDRLSCDNSTAFFTMLGWIQYDFDNRIIFLEQLLKQVMIEFVDLPAAGLDAFDESDIFQEALTRAKRYRSLSLKEKVSFWKRPSVDIRESMWPKFSILCSTGNSQATVACRLNGRCIKLTNKPQKLTVNSSGSTMCVVNNVLYFFGGQGNMGIWTYNVQYDLWRLLSKEQEERIRPSVAEMDGQIYIFGGYSAKPSGSSPHYFDSVLRFDPNSQTFSFLSPMETSRSGAGVACCNGKIYLFGGLSSRRQVVAKCIAYDVAKDEFEDVTSLPLMTVDFGVCVVDSKVFLIGGMDPLTCETKNTVLVYDIANCVWIQDFASLNVARKSCACFYDGIFLNVVGGTMASPLAQLSSCERFCFNSGKWVLIDNLPKSLNSSLSCVIENVPVRLMENYRDLGMSNVRVQI